MEENNVEPELRGGMTYNMPRPRMAATESFSLRSSRTCHNNGMGRRAVLDRVSKRTLLGGQHQGAKPIQRVVLVSDD